MGCLSQVVGTKCLLRTKCGSLHCLGYSPRRRDGRIASGLSRGHLIDNEIAPLVQSRLVRSVDTEDQRGFHKAFCGCGILARLAASDSEAVQNVRPGEVV